MSQIVENIERSYSVLPVDEKLKEQNDELRKRYKAKNAKDKKKLDSHTNNDGIQNVNVLLPKEDALLHFSINKQTGETEASVLNNTTKMSHSVNFDDVSKASEKVFERPGIVFDKRA